MNRLMIIGASGHGKVCADIARLIGYKEITFLDDDESIKECGGYPVIGESSDAAKLNAAEPSDFFVAIGNAYFREKIMVRLESDSLCIVSLIHPSAVIAEDTKIEVGTCVMAGTVINPGTVIGEGCIINTGATVDHDNDIGDFVHVSVGVHLAGTVQVGAYTWIGVGAVVSNNINICENCVIGAGAVVIRNIEQPGTYVGVPARKVEK